MADHVRDDDVELYVLGRLTADVADAIDDHVRHCGKCCDAIQAAASSLSTRNRALRKGRNDEERRLESRTLTEEAGLLQVLQPLSLKRLAVTISNASGKGLGLRVAEHLDAGGLVQIRTRHAVLLAEVRYCIKAGGEFLAGVQVEKISDTPEGRT